MDAPATLKPRRWKLIALTFAIVFPTVEVLTRGVAPHLGFLHPLVRDVVVVGTMCTVLSYALPAAQARWQGWLRR